MRRRKRHESHFQESSVRLADMFISSDSKRSPTLCARAAVVWMSRDELQVGDIAQLDPRDGIIMSLATKVAFVTAPEDNDIAATDTQRGCSIEIHGLELG